MATKVLTVGGKNINSLTVGELREMCDSKDLEYTKQNKESGLIKIIMESGKFDAQRQDGGKRNEDGKLVHPIHGEYIKCIVHPQAKYNRDGAIHIGINKYTADVQPRIPVMLPKAVIKFLKNATDAKHIYNKDAISENGNVGQHQTIQVPKYVVEILLEDD